MHFNFKYIESSLPSVMAKVWLRELTRQHRMLAVDGENPKANLLLCSMLESAHELDSAEMRGLVVALRVAGVGTGAGRCAECRYGGQFPDGLVRSATAPDGNWRRQSTNGGEVAP